MTKLIPMVAAGVFALSLSGGIFAADQKPPDQSQNQSPKDQTAYPADQSKKEQDYLVALKRCENQQGDAKQKCVEQAKEKFNRM